MKKSEKGKKFINPFDRGVTYEMFLDSCPKNVDLDSYLKGKCEPAQIEWLKQELKQFKTK